jgi:hypothetical protein
MRRISNDLLFCPYPWKRDLCVEVRESTSGKLFYTVNSRIFSPYYFQIHRIAEATKSYGRDILAEWAMTQVVVEYEP